MERGQNLGRNKIESPTFRHLDAIHECTIMELMTENK